MKHGCNFLREKLIPMQFWRHIRNRDLPRSEFDSVRGTLVRSMGSTQIKVFPGICFGKNFMLQVQRVKKFSQVIRGHKRSLSNLGHIDGPRIGRAVVEKLEWIFETRN